MTKKIVNMRFTNFQCLVRLSDDMVFLVLVILVERFIVKNPPTQLKIKLLRLEFYKTNYYESI